MAWESVLGTITGLNGSTCGLVDASKFPAQTPIGYTTTVDYTGFDVPNAEALAGIEFGGVMLDKNSGAIQLVDGTASGRTWGFSLDYNQPPNSGNLTSFSPNSDWFDWYKVYIICGVDVENQVGRVGLLMAPRSDPPQSGWAEWCLYWSSVSDKAFNWINNNVIPSVQSITSNGGGATHIAKVTGQLKDLSSHLSDILIVSGGGGGGMLIGDTVYPGADAGGIAGNSDNSADQATGYAFGQGESGSDVSGGGGGLYGGYKGGTAPSRWIDAILFNNSVKILGYCTNDYPIPAKLINATSPDRTRSGEQGYARGVSTLPTGVYIGDVLWSENNTTDTYVFLDDDNFRIIFGVYQKVAGTNRYGLGIYCKRTSSWLYDGDLWSSPNGAPSSTHYENYYFDIKIDEENQRAYLVVVSWLTGHTEGNGYTILMMGGKYNGTDIFYESLHNLDI